jgi:predicted GNAT family N-acyltransferase
MKIVFRAIEYGTEDYASEVALRYDILRRPLGLRFSKEDLEAEAEYLHFGAFRQNHLVGTMQFVRLSHREWKMRQVAVSKAEQGQGIGRIMVAAAERRAREDLVQMISLHARCTAISFYEKLEYQCLGEIFLEVGLPHRKMQKVFSIDKQS